MIKSRACSNVALLKYWGRRDGELRLPTNNSFSVTLSGLTTETVLSESGEDVVVLNGELVEGEEMRRVQRYLDLIAGEGRLKCRVESVNSFPAKTGLSSSASGFAALAVAGNEFFGLSMGVDDLSRMARKGSGSACRSIHGGWVVWNAGNSDSSSVAERVFDENHWDLVILAVVVSDKNKEVPTSGGQELAWTSPYFKARLEIIKDREREMVEAVEQKDFEKFALAVEREMFEFHAIPMTSNPPLVYWYPETLRVIKEVSKFRDSGVPVCCTINTGHNVFVITEAKFKNEVEKMLMTIESVEKLIPSKVGASAKVVT